VQKWEQTWQQVLSRLRTDPVAARERAKLGWHNVERTRRMLGAKDPDAAVIFAELALINAADAVLIRDGYRARGKTGAHQARFEYPLLPSVFADGRRVIARARSLRNAAAYEGVGRISRAEAMEIVDLAAAAVDAVTETLSPERRP
jgi:hypothetical protein